VCYVVEPSVDVAFGLLLTY